jgi:multidrug resistance efflux pump
MKVWLRVDAAKDVSAAIREKVKAMLVIAESKRNLINLRRESYVLRATREGIVSQIRHNPGDIVVAADPVLRVIPGPDHIAGFLPEIQLSELKVGERVLITRRTGLGAPVHAVVESIGPEVQTLPARLAPIRGQPLRGRRVMVKLADGHNFIPGETVTISSTQSSWTRFEQQVARFFRR